MTYLVIYKLEKFMFYDQPPVMAPKNAPADLTKSLDADSFLFSLSLSRAEAFSGDDSFKVLISGLLELLLEIGSSGNQGILLDIANKFGSSIFALGLFCVSFNPLKTGSFSPKLISTPNVP